MTDPSQDLSDDPRLTAYALGELEGAERAEIEALVRSNPAAAAAVAEIRRLAGSLADALKDESIDIRLAAEVASIESGQRSVLRRLQPYLYVASGLAAGWATALLLFRPAPSPRFASPIAEKAVSISMEQKRAAVSAGAAPASAKPGPPALSFSFGRFNFLPPKGDPLPRVQPMVPQAIVDSAQLREDLKNFEIVQPALGAGARISLEQKQQDASAGIKDIGVVKLSPFEVASNAAGYYTANTLAGTRLNSKLSDLGSPLTIAPAHPTPAGSPNSPSVVYGQGQLLPLAGGPKPPADSYSQPQTLSGTRISRVAAAFGGAPATERAPDPLRGYKDQLRALKVIDGTQVGQAALPGQFSRLYPTFLMDGSRAAYEQMMIDSNPEVSAMGALCLMTVYPAERAGILAKMSLDLRPITYVRAGSAPQSSTLGALFQSIASDPGFLFPLGTPPARP